MLMIFRGHLAVCYLGSDIDTEADRFPHFYSSPSLPKQAFSILSWQPLRGKTSAVAFSMLIHGRKSSDRCSEMIEEGW